MTGDNRDQCRAVQVSAGCAGQLSQFLWDSNLLGRVEGSQEAGPAPRCFGRGKRLGTFVDFFAYNGCRDNAALTYSRALSGLPVTLSQTFAIAAAIGYSYCLFCDCTTPCALFLALLMHTQNFLSNCHQVIDIIVAPNVFISWRKARV